MELSDCCREKIDYGLGKVGGFIRCSMCRLICDKLEEMNEQVILGALTNQDTEK